VTYSEIRIVLLCLLLAWQLWSGRLPWTAGGERGEINSETSPILYWLILAIELALVVYVMVLEPSASRSWWDRQVLFTIPFG